LTAINCDDRKAVNTGNRRKGKTGERKSTRKVKIPRTSSYFYFC